MNTMTQKILVFRGQNDAVLEERTLPELASGEFRIRTTHSLVSPGTELALYRRTHIGFDDPDVTWCAYPLDIGYASVGVVEESKSDATPVGTRIAHYGPHANVVTIGSDGPVWTEVPDSLSSEKACFGRFAQIAYSAVAASPRPARNVLVYGAGIVGNLAAQWFSDGGAITGIIDMSPQRLAIAKACGISTTLVAGTSEATFGAPDTIVEATGVAAVVGEALERIAPHGQVVLLGSIRHHVSINAYKDIHRKASILTGAHETVLGDDRTPILQKSLEAIHSGRVVVDPIITKRISPSELPDVYDRIIDDPDSFFGVVVDWNQE